MSRSRWSGGHLWAAAAEAGIAKVNDEDFQALEDLIEEGEEELPTILEILVTLRSPANRHGRASRLRGVSDYPRQGKPARLHARGCARLITTW